MGKCATVIKCLLTCLLVDGSILRSVFCIRSHYSYPFAVRIRPRTNTSSSLQDCTGYIHNPSTVVTSASCIHSTNEIIRNDIIVRPKGESDIVYTSSKWRIHPRYEAGKKGYNLMVIILDSPLKYDGNTRIADIASTDNRRSRSLKYLAGLNKHIYHGKYGKRTGWVDCGEYPYGSYCGLFGLSASYIGSSEGDLILNRFNGVLGIYDQISTNQIINVKMKVLWTAVDKFVDWIEETIKEMNVPTSTTKPSITTPSITSPSVTSPLVTSPSVTSPSVASPSTTSPSITTPSVTISTVTIPSIATPSSATPPITSSKSISLPSSSTTSRTETPTPKEIIKRMSPTTISFTKSSDQTPSAEKSV